MLLSHPSTSLVSLHLALEYTLCVAPLMFAALVVQLPSTLFFKTPCSVWLRVQIFVEMQFATVGGSSNCAYRSTSLNINPIHNRRQGEELKTLWRC
ncbi:hypothetical protein CPC08DRAFT_715143 [Agrocybe pediades]|nr:hypothetical protein CPC08DRAFT_715143 [Agrocybe pediades]